jgi:prolipoprotein diacylglyceryltransferase
MKKKKKKQYRSNPKKYKKESLADIPLWMCIVFIVLGGVLGSIFTYDCLYLNQIIDREEAIVATGRFDSYEFSYGKGGDVSEVRIDFIDRDELYIDTAYHVEMDEKLEALEKGEQLTMLLHPNSEAIWELTAEKSVILSFDDAKSRTQFENGFFMFFLVSLCLICISMGVVALWAKYFEYKKKIQNKNTATSRGSI